MSERPDLKLTAHLFVCTNQKNKGACCADRGGKELRSRVKHAAKERGWKGRVRVNASGCLDQCERGVAAVLYPEGRWFTDLKDDEASERKLIDAIEKALAEDEKKSG